MTAADRRFMEQALALGALGEGTTSPNPRVGCLLVRDGEVVGRGYHRRAGGPHAEALALAEAGEAARGATAYVNLEPCAHQGRTPPCADMLARSGVSRVVASLQDPDPRVDGKGFERLRQAGVEVEVGLMVDEAEQLNEAFLHRQRHGRPMVTIKAAISLDGMIAGGAGRSKWISGESSRRFAHRLRLRHDAVLVGAETLRRDDPRLTTRLDGNVRQGHRVVLTSRLDLSADCALLAEAPDGAPMPRLYTGPDASVEREAAFEGRARVVRVAQRGRRLDLAAVLEDLASQGVQSVLVEGGGRTIAGFVDAGLADRGAIFVTRKLLGAVGGTPFLARPSVAGPTHGWRLEQPCQIGLDGDLLLIGRLASPAPGDA